VGLNYLLLAFLLVHCDFAFANSFFIDSNFLLDAFENLLVLVLDQGGLLFRLYDLLFLDQIMLIQEHLLVLLLPRERTLKILELLLLHHLILKPALFRRGQVRSVK